MSLREQEGPALSAMTLGSVSEVTMEASGRDLDEVPVLLGVVGVAGGHGRALVLCCQAGTGSGVPEELVLKGNAEKHQPGP